VSNAVTIGADVVLAYQSSGGSSITAYGIAPRVGIAKKLGPKLVVWPTVSFLYAHTKLDFGGGAGAGSGNVATLQAFVPFLFVVAPHFFLGGGPLFKTDLYVHGDGGDGPKTTAIGVQFLVGGYF
jgi:hypothetical protein